MSVSFFICKSRELGQYIPSPERSLRREGYSIIYTGSEESTIILNKKHIAVPAQTSIFVSPTCLLGIPQGQDHLDVLYFTSDFYIRNNQDMTFLQSCSLFPEGNYSTIEIPTEYLLYTQYIAEMQYDAFKNIENPLYSLLLHNLIEQSLIQTAIQRSTTTTPTFYDDADLTIVTLFKDLLKTYVHKNRTVKFYADKLNMTSWRLAKATHNAVDKTPKDIITDYILSQVKWQLIYGSQSIKEIGRTYGFLDENNFSAFFSKEMGLTPTEFRKQHRQNNLEVVTKE